MSDHQSPPPPPTDENPGREFKSDASVEMAMLFVVLFVVLALSIS